MTRRTFAAMAGSAALAVALAGCGGSGQTGTGSRAEARVSTTAYEAPQTRPRGVVENCSTRSEAGFPDAFSNPSNVVVGPLVFVGAAFTPPETIREFGGNKFPVLVRAGHRVTVALPRRTRAVAGLGYGPLPEGVELTPRDGHRVVTFKACRRGEKSGSTAGDLPVTFWSGFVLTKSPRCVPLEVWVDNERAPWRTTLRMGMPHCP